MCYAVKIVFNEYIFFNILIFKTFLGFDLTNHVDVHELRKVFIIKLAFFENMLNN